MANPAKATDSVAQVLSFEDRNFSFSGSGIRRKAADNDAPLVGIIETLNSEHGYIASLLDKLEAEAAKLKPGKVPDYPLLLDIIDYLTHYPGQYHHPREDLLFKTLLKRDKNFQSTLDRLQREHETLHSYNDKLFKQVRAIVAGEPADRPELLSTLNSYVRGYRNHIGYESSKIFPSAKGKLSKAELGKLDARTRYLDDPLFGGQVQQQYRRLGRSLRATLEDVSFDLVSRQYTALEYFIMRLSEALTEASERRRALSLWPTRRKRGGSPSWQARVLNAFTRRTMKPLMRFGSIESMRSMTERLDAQQDARTPPDVKVRAVSGKSYQGEWINIARKRPRKVLLYFPGGGFIIRTATQHRLFVAKICKAANTRALLVHYSLAPEIPFPGGLEDCLAAYHDLLEQGIKPADITVAGDSAGGGLVMSTLLALRDEGTPLPANAIVLSPLGDLTYSGESRKLNKHKDPILPTHRSSEMHQLYIGEALPEDRFISPVFADFDGLPPMLGQVGSTEILLDDTVRAARQAEDANVPFFLEVWNEMPHVFPIFGLLPEAQVAIDRMAEFINSSSLEPLPERYAVA
ncbi:MAG: alpha/beta hydrolase fold domain-containing protein [Halieaceae bacterium]